MIHRTRTAALAAAAPTAGLVLSLFFATAAAAPEAVPPSAPAPAATSAAPDAPAPTADPISGVRSSATAEEDAAAPVALPPVGPAGGEPVGTAPRESPVPPAPIEQVSVEQGPVEQDPVEQGAGGVDVGVAIDPPTDPGALAMTVAGEAVALSESASTAAVRRFVGTLPTVTVRDTRTPVTDRPGWSVLGTASALTGTSGQPPIGVEHLGWAPRLLEGDSVAAGPVALTVLDDAAAGSRPGLVEAPLLTIAEGARPGRWTADAELVLQTPASVRAGRYAAVLTLSLFE
ncbi:hypothetical protein NB037_08115 [Rathayibacter sp. ZW T2_19]|uniref:Uncharacterized protein n=1 Tax=Rathayibacter rubneri TaxID=2950106 RepID=A0A9X2DY25_9MICO|nr:hypothetical protein [Rathayibacter rubneri]MCM6762381.1 hypothetical protein [Rathayibacter rubneri]